VFTDLVARLKAEGRTVVDRLEDLARQHGLHATRQISVRRPVEEIRVAVERVIAEPPTEIAGRAVTSVEQPADDILVLHLDGDTRVVIRPSGTEPKLKTYLQVVLEEIPEGQQGFDAARQQAADELEALRAGVIEILQLGD
jgi:phosphomannomutase